MTLELRKKYVLFNDLQYIYKHLFNNTQCKTHNNRHISYQWSHYYAYGALRIILSCSNKQMAQ